MKDMNFTKPTAQGGATVDFLRIATSNNLDEAQAREITRLYQSGYRSSSEIKLLAKAYLAQVNEKILDLRSNRVLLEHLSGTCYGDDRPYCPILIALALSPLADACP